MDLDVLLPFHRADKYFTEAIESLAASKYLSVNVILIDDRPNKSKDITNVLRVLKNFEVVSTSGGVGYGEALKLGSQLITANSVALHNSDDLVDPHRFFKQVKYLENSDLNITAMQRINKYDRKIYSLSGEIQSSFYDPYFLLLGSYGANASWCMRSDWWRKNVFFDSEECLDWRIAFKTFSDSSLSYTSEKLYFYRKHPNQITTKKEVNFSEMKKVYDAWSNFSALKEIGNYSYETFLIFALPWSKAPHVNLREIRDFSLSLSERIKHADFEAGKDLDTLLRRRYIYALRGRCNLFTKLWLVFKGAKEIPQIAKEIFKNWLS
jgi:glycosyltransferase involved in cell wall biosynthesis